jgi:hypothetical protein
MSLTCHRVFSKYGKEKCNFHNRRVKRYAHRVKDFVHAAELRQACARDGSFGREKYFEAAFISPTSSEGPFIIPLGASAAVVKEEENSDIHC